MVIVARLEIHFRVYRKVESFVKCVCKQTVKFYTTILKRKQNIGSSVDIRERTLYRIDFIEFKWKTNKIRSLALNDFD